MTNAQVKELVRLYEIVARKSFEAGYYPHNCDVYNNAVKERDEARGLINRMLYKPIKISKREAKRRLANYFASRPSKRWSTE